MPGGGDGGIGSAGLGLDFSAVIQAALVGFVLFAASAGAIRRAASRYFAIDRSTAYDHRHHPMQPPQGDQQPQHQPTVQGPCAQCKRVRYCSQGCQIMHWQSDHKFKCEQMRLLDPVQKLPCGVEASRRDNEKWKQMNNGCSPPKKRSNQSNTEQVNDEDDEDGRSPTPSSVVPPKRGSPGRKAEKKLKTGGDGVVFKSTAQGMIAVKKEMEVERKQEEEARWMDVNAMEERKLAIEEEKLRLLGEEVCVKRMEQEYKIMFMDISGLGETQREYVELMRAKILASRRRAGAIGSV